MKPCAAKKPIQKKQKPRRRKDRAFLRRGFFILFVYSFPSAPASISPVRASENTIPTQLSTVCLRLCTAVKS